MSRWLKTLGKLPADFDGEKLLPLLSHRSERVRVLAAANLGKLKNPAYLPHLLRAAREDSSTMARREAASAIGRMQSQKAIPALTMLTNDDDPKVVLQALRGLLALPKKTAAVHAALEKLRNHPNEIIKETIAYGREFHQDTPKSRAAQTSSPDFMKNLAVQGDALSVLKAAPADSVHLTFTSPPYYNARDYSIYPSYARYLDFLAKVFRQVLRLTKPGRFFVLNTSPIVIPRLEGIYPGRRYPIPFDLHSVLTKLGWEFVDDILWSKPESMVKNRNRWFSHHRKPLEYRPNTRTEYLMVYRKKCSRLIDWNIRQYDSERLRRSLVKGDYDTNNIWEVAPVFDREHSAVFPAALCQRVVRYYSFADDLILDPFGGSGTLGRTAAAMGRYFFTVEVSPDYIARMKEIFDKNSETFYPKPCFVSEAQFAAMAKREK